MRTYDESTFLKAADGSPVMAKGEVVISPTLQTSAGTCRLRNLKLAIIECSETILISGNSSPGEIFLGNDSLKKLGLDVEDYLAHNTHKLDNIDMGALGDEKISGTVGKIGSKLLSQAIDEDVETINCGKMFSTNKIFPLKDGDNIDYKNVNVGVQDENELDISIKKMIARGQDCLPEEMKGDQKSMVMKHKDIFRTTLRNDPPVKVPAMEIEFENEEKAVKVRQRTYSPEQTEFLKRKIKELCDCGFIKRNNSSNWACAPLFVPKTGKEGFRFTVYLRPVNAQSKKVVWPMSNADAMLSKLAGSKTWFNLDFLHGYWQFPLAENSRDCQPFHTPFGVYTHNRVLHGATNAVSYFQSSMESIFGHLNLLIYLDDLLGYATTKIELL